jgi:hypothetical protein
MSPKAADVMRFSDAIMAEIEHDMTIGFSWGKKLPRTVASFSELHEHVDANEYVLNALEGAFPRGREDDDEYIFSDAENDMANAVMEEVNRRLALMQVTQHFCATCGNETQGPDQTCSCWCLLADALQHFLGMDFDGAAQFASDLWREHADNRAYVWSGEWAAEHDLPVYPKPAKEGEST